MKKIIFTTLFVMVLGGILGCTGKPGQQNMHHRGGAAVDKSGDTVLAQLKETVLPKFQQMTWEDSVTGQSMEYNLFVPADYVQGKSYPIVMFICDASCAGKEVKFPLEQGYGALIWATDEDQQRHPCFVLAPAYKAKAVDDDWSTTDEVEMTIRLLQAVIKQYGIDTTRVYTTGQSMGGMMSMYYNITHPDLFAASIFVGCQWDTSKMDDFGNRKFFYIVSGGDKKASGGMAQLTDVLQRNQAKFDSATWSAKLPATEQDANVKDLLSKGSNVNFIVFTEGTVLNEDGCGNEHMSSFDYAYKLNSVRDWLFEQKK